MQAPAIEFKSREEIKAFQEAELKKLIQYVNQNSVFYKELFAKHKINPQAINSLEDLAKIPTTSKYDLNQRNNDFICVNPVRIIDYVTTSGTLGDPVTFALTDKDLDRLAYNEAISFLCTGCNENDVLQLMTTIDRRFMAGLAYFLGARKLGAGIVRVGSGIPELQWDTIKRLNPTALIAVPSFLLKLIEYAEANGIDYNATSIKKAICIGEPIRNEDFSYNTLGQKITEKWNLRLFSTYASTEMVTAFTECQAGQGGHHHPELIIVEFLDDDELPVKEGEEGEVVITTLGVEGMPLIRFKTGDICRANYEKCSCGRTSLRLGPIVGRKNQMLKYKGTTLYPPALYDLLNDIQYVENYVVEVFTNSIGTDEILIRVGTNHASDALEKEIKDHFRAKLRVAPMIKFEPVELIQKIQMPDTSRKPIKFFDRR
ncbi:MAG: phenylacetate--CoA ligase family protein [Cytophagaceae bacterium]